MSHPFLSDMDNESADPSGVSAQGQASDDGQPSDAFALEHSEPDGRRINQSMLLLVLVAAVATGALVLMRAGGATGIDTSLRDVEVKIEAALGAASSVGAPGQPMAPGQTDEIIAQFTQSPAERQVPISEVAVNPFVSLNDRLEADESPTAVKPEPVEPAVDPEAQRAARRRAQLQDEHSRLTLQTVMNGRVPMALVSGEIVRVGDSLGSFTVASIQPMKVVLTPMAARTNC